MNNLSGSLSFHGNVSGQIGANLIPSVEANPSGTATQILTSIRVGDIIYSIPSGGGGGGGTNDYNSLLNKPKINNVTLEGNKTASDLKLISEIHTASGAEAAIETDDTLPLLNCVSDINPVQSGSGTPSPSNVRPISGHTDVTITVASTSGGSGDDTTVSLGRTVYGGTLDVTTGELTVDKGYFDLSNAGATFYKSALTGADRFYSQISTIATDMKTSGFNDFDCDYFEEKTEQSEEVGTAYIQTGWINIQMTKDMFATGASFKTWIESESVHIVYELATPQTFTLSKEQIVTLSGDNYIRSDTGDIEITYVTNVIDPLLKYLLENR